MKDNEQTYLSRIGLMKPRYQQRSSRLRDYNRAMKTMEERTGVKMTRPAKEVKTSGGQSGMTAAERNERRLVNARQKEAGYDSRNQSKKLHPSYLKDTKTVLREAFGGQKKAVKQSGKR